MRICRSFFVSALSSALVAICSVSSAGAQERLPLKGPGLGNLTYQPSELFREISTINHDVENGIPVRQYGVYKRYGVNVGAMINGYFVTSFAPDSGQPTGGLLVFDVSDPRNIRRLKTVFDPSGETKDFREAHSMGVATINGRTYLAHPTTKGVEFWDFTDINEIRKVSSISLKGINGGDYFDANWQMWWQAPYLYVAGSNQGIYIVDTSDPIRPVLVDRGHGKENPVKTSDLGGFPVGPIFTMGNTMVITSMESSAPFTTLDISDPKNPVPISGSKNIPFYYATCYDGHRLFTTGRRFDSKFQGYDLTNPRNIILENNNTPSREGLYCTTQDQYLIIGAQRQIIKYDTSRPDNYTIVGESPIVADDFREFSLLNPIGEPDLGQVSMFGNLVFVGSDHGMNTAFRPHQLAPDTTPPSVINVSPNNGATGQAVTSRIGFALSDAILQDTVNSDTFIVRKKGSTEQLKGTYSVQLGIINFFPEVYLDPNTEYEAVLVKGGVKDYAGNPIEEQYISKFTTGPIASGAIALKHHWPLKNDLVDVVNGTNGQNPSLTDDFREGGLNFAVRKQPVDLATDVPAEILTKSATLSFSIKTTQRGSRDPWNSPGIFGSDQVGGTNDIFWGWIDHQGSIRFSIGDNFSVSAGYNIADGKWHDVVISRNHATGRVTISVDDDIREFKGKSGIFGFTQKFTKMGEIAGSNQKFSGVLANVKIFDGQLSLSQQRRVLGKAPTMASDAVVGASTTFTPAKLQLFGKRFKWDFGDSSPQKTTFGSTDAVQHRYLQPGNYRVSVEVTDTDGTVEVYSFTQVVTYPLTPKPPIHSSNIIGDRNHVYSVNPDSGTVAAVDKQSLKRVWEVYVGKEPQSIALDHNGMVWVAVRGDDKISRINPRTKLVDNISTGYGSAPHGIVIMSNGTGIVTLAGKSQVATFNSNSGDIKFGHPLPNGDYRGIAVSGDNLTALFPRFRTNNAAAGGRNDAHASMQAEVYRIDPRYLRVSNAEKLIALSVDGQTRGTGGSAPGVPNYLHQIVISPDGRKALIPSKKDNVVDGEFRNGVKLRPDTTVRSIVSTIDLANDKEVFEEQIDFNDLAPARAVLFTPKGNYLFVALMESNTVLVYDAFRRVAVGVIRNVGLAPHGLYLDAENKTLYVNNFLSRDITVHDVSGVLDGTNFNTLESVSVKAVEKEPFSPNVLAGKQLFYNAASNKMSSQGYISCASCHVDGDSDGTIWDFTQRGEGLRRTISLQGRSGASSSGSKLHWTANFDEVHDFEKDIRMEFGGMGFMSDADYNATIDPLGAKKAGRSQDLDNLAEYVSSLSDFNRSPFRTKEGCLTKEAIVGKGIFERLKCASCHGTEPGVADNKLHDVGTFQPSSGKGSGKTLVGIDTPTLDGLWESNSFYHNGQARQLSDVFTQDKGNPNLNFSPVHGGAVAKSEIGPLVAYLNSLDGRDMCNVK